MYEYGKTNPVVFKRYMLGCSHVFSATVLDQHIPRRDTLQGSKILYIYMRFDTNLKKSSTNLKEHIL